MDDVEGTTETDRADRSNNGCTAGRAAASESGMSGLTSGQTQTLSLVDTSLPLSSIEISSPSAGWCPLQAYTTPPHTHMMCSMAGSAAETVAAVQTLPFQHDIDMPSPISYPELGEVPKYEMMTMKYELEDTPKEYNQSLIYQKEEHEIKQENEADETTMVCEEKRNDQIPTEMKEANRNLFPAKRGRPTENPCWNYFIRIDDQNVKCRICNKIVKSACATNMTKHLERHHQIRHYRALPTAAAGNMRQTKTCHSTARAAMAFCSATQPQTACLLPTTNHFVKTESYRMDEQMAAYDSYTFQPTAVVDAFHRQGTTELGSSFSEDTSSWHLNHHWPHWPDDMASASSSSTLLGGIVIEQGIVPSLPTPSSISWTRTDPHSAISVSPSTTTNSSSPVTERTYMKRNRKTEHPVWEFFKRTSDGNAQCTICAGIVKSPCSSNFMRHLMRHHQEHYNNVYLKWVQKRTTVK